MKILCPKCYGYGAYRSQSFPDILVHKCDESLLEVAHIYNNFIVSLESEFINYNNHSIVRTNIFDNAFSKNKSLSLKANSNFILIDNKILLEIEGLNLLKIHELKHLEVKSFKEILKYLHKQNYFSENMLTYNLGISETPF